VSSDDTTAGDPAPACPTCAHYAWMGRRRFLGMLGVGAAVAIAACDNAKVHAASAIASPPTAAPATTAIRPPMTSTTAPSTTVSTTVPSPVPPVVELGLIPPPRPGAPQVIFQASAPTRHIAITIDDGYCAPCVNGYVAFAKASGIHITFSPNGTYSALWTPHAPVLRSLIEAGQVQIGNHTFSHPDVTRLSTARVQEEIERNEAWIESTFGITSRPWFRPPFGNHSARTDHIAGELGFTNILMWNGSFGDSTPITPEQLMSLARRWLLPGTVMLGHANYPTITPLWGQIQALIAERKLEPVTLDEMFGTSRRTG
jgi:peptidoglycan/xylan/chitin deacetylase (PgdA/CDA1 family)